jgi:small-conductance mechanosensitive channel
VTDLLGNNEPQALAVAAGIAAGSLLLVAIVVWLARHRFRNAQATARDTDDLILDLAVRTRLVLLLIPAVYLGSRALDAPLEIAALIRVLARLCLIAQGAFWLAGVVDFLMRRYRRRRVESDPSAITTIRAFRFAALTAVWSVALLVALDNLGVNVTTLITGLGIGGVAIALATQNILGDLFASLSIVVDKPFVVGDFINAGTDMGTVEYIGLKTTRVRSLSGEQLVFSNSDLLQSRIRNFRNMKERRVLFRLGVVYQTPIQVLRAIPNAVRAIIERTPLTRFDRGHFAVFGESAYEFEFVYYVLSAEYSVHANIQETVNLAIVEEFARMNVAFAYPSRTLYVERSTQSPSALED